MKRKGEKQTLQKTSKSTGPGSAAKPVSNKPDKASVSTDPAEPDPVQSYKYDASLSITKYGYAARLKRAECLHTFLAYMIYNYEGKSALL